MLEANNHNSEVVAKHWNNKRALQPRIMLAGPISEAAAHVYVVDIQYVLPNIKEGFEACFKSYLALNCEYPVECDHVWFFIQKCVFNIATPYDTQNSTIETFIKSLSL